MEGSQGVTVEILQGREYLLALGPSLLRIIRPRITVLMVPLPEVITNDIKVAVAFFPERGDDQRLIEGNALKGPAFRQYHTELRSAGFGGVHGVEVAFIIRS